jgi:hypothetical protein
MSLGLKQPHEGVDKPEPRSTIKTAFDDAAEQETSIPIPDEKEEAATKTKDLQPEREATFKDYLVRNRYHRP